MDEMTVLRELRTDAPAADAARLAAGRWKLMGEALAEEAPAGRWHRAARLGRTVAGTRPRRTALAALTAAAVTAGVLAAGAVSGGTGGSTDVSARSVASVMDAVAAQEEARGGGTFRADQWLYSRMKYCVTAAPCSLKPESWWLRADGDAEAFPLTGHGGKTVAVQPGWSVSLGARGGPGSRPVDTYELLDSLPSDPRALLDRINHDPDFFVRGLPKGALVWVGRFDFAPITSQTPEAQFQRVANLLSLPDVPPRIRAALYRALALVPGVRLDAEPAKDATGRSGIGVVFEGRPQPKGFWVERYELLFDSRTHAYLGSRASFGIGARRDAYVASNAVLATGVVDHAGQVPGGPVPPSSSIETRPPLTARGVTPPKK
ncbi:CU044_5270 family protein [Streptomyces sp. NPDC021020]|uniref:CU044_5270 family protein n=1 Tax=Streptomyces sp. NPDC021020 TaxID=3365109 RepID=UPI0037AF2B17